ncbi:TetR/AcrR family transcriptional regulator C-terminal domain-containing protein, partial [Rhizobium sp. BR5]
PNNVRTVLLDFIEHHVKIGHLKVDDVELAARQFIELSTGTFFKLRLFGELDGPVPEEELDRVIGSAIKVFMAAYGTDKA